MQFTERIKAISLFIFANAKHIFHLCFITYICTYICICRPIYRSELTNLQEIYHILHLFIQHTFSICVVYTPRIGRNCPIYAANLQV